MATKKRGLGRGLDALLSGNTQPAPIESEGATDANIVDSESTTTTVIESSAPTGDLRDLPVDLLQPGKYQPRTDMHQESLQELANSIKAQGVLQPIVVRKISESGRYEIIAGERRWRAAQLAELHEVPAVIREVPDEAAIAMALIENIQREDLNPIEEATALQRLIDEFELTHQQAADAVGRSRAAVSNLLRLLSLNEEVRKLLENGDLEMGHARSLLSLDTNQQSKTARDVVARGLSVRETEQLVNKLRQNDKSKSTKPSKTVDPNIQRLQEDLAGKLGAKVALQHAANGKGKLVVHYNSLDELDGILAHIK